MRGFFRQVPAVIERPEPEAEIIPPGAKTWDDLVRLRESLGRLTNGGNTDLMITMWRDGDVSVTLSVGSSKYCGRGKDPWAAVDDLLQQSGSLANKLMTLV